MNIKSTNRIMLIVLVLCALLLLAIPAAAAPALPEPSRVAEQAVQAPITFRDFLSLFLATALPGGIAVWVLGRKRFEDTPKEAKPFIAFGIAAVVCVVAYLAQVAMLYEPQPATWRAWVEALFGPIGWAFTCSQGIYWGDRAIKAYRAARQPENIGPDALRRIG